MISEINFGLTQFINYSLHDDFLTGFFLVFNFFGSPAFILLLSLALFLFPYRKKQIKFSLWVPASYLLSRSFVELLKRLFYVARPFENSLLRHYWLDKSADGSSFPSGHAMTAFLVVILLSRYFKFRGFKHWAFCALAIPVALGRVYLGVHWFGDVLAGALLGILFGLISWNIYQKVVLSRNKQRRD